MLTRKSEMHLPQDISRIFAVKMEMILAAVMKKL